MDIGGELRTARQARSLSVDAIARATKISPRILTAIERNTFDAVPRGPFIRGYLKSYAREVGLDGDELVRRYREAFDAPEPAPQKAAVLPADDAIDANGPLAASTTSHILQIAVIVVVAVAYLVSQRPAKEASASERLIAEQSSPAASVVPPVASADVPVGTSGRVEAAPEQLTVELRAEGPCWIEASVDGERAIARLMNAGERETVAVKDGLAMRVGDPAALAFSINGVAGRPLGPEGRVVAVRIDRANYRQFLAN
jgi:cytoskeleton protein RodZ